MNRNNFPYRPRKIPKVPAPPVPLKSKGVELELNPNAWLTGGPVREIEKGLPLIMTPLPALDPDKQTPLESAVTLLVDKPYLKSYKKMYGQLTDKYPDLNFNDPDSLSIYEKQFIFQNSHEMGEMIMKAGTLKLNLPDENGNIQPTLTATAPLDAHLYTFGGAIPYFQSQIFADNDDAPKKVITKPKKPKTGIYGTPHEEPNIQSSLIREINFRTITDEEVEKYKSEKDDAEQPLSIPQQSLGVTTRKTRLDPSTDDSTVKDCIHMYFQPNGKPYVPKNVEKLFPCLFEPGDIIEQPSPTVSDQLLRTTTEVFSLDQSASQNLTQMMDPMSAIVDMDPQSTLLDTSDQDVLFTKRKAPFRRVEIARMKAFTHHWDKLKIEQNKKFAEERKRRDKLVQKSFQSKKVMETYMKLLEKECLRCRSGLLGKSPFKNKSMWETALEKAPYDPGALGVRMEFWWRFCIFAGETRGVRTDYEKEVAMALRNFLMDNHPVTQKLFSDVIMVVSRESLQSVGSLKLLEFIRICLDVEQKTFQKCLEQRSIPLIVYSQTILTNLSADLLTVMKRIAKMDVDVPEPNDLV